ncbi:MAG: LysM peptidoglycan-binding domain-containing protein [Phycisphaerae bacterium]
MIKKSAILLCVLLLQAVAASAQTDYSARRADELSSLERRRLDNTAVLSQESLDEIEEVTSAEALREQVEQILSRCGGNLGIGSRDYDEQGRAPIHNYLLERIEDLQDDGVEYVGSLKGRVAVPVSLDRLEDPEKRGKPATLTVGDESWVLQPLWPNGAMPSLCPKDGLSGPLIDVGIGDWDEIKGLDLDGAIVLMDFQGGRRWDRLMSLGARAVVVVEDDRVSREKAEGLFCNTPVPMPRFYVDAETGREIRSHATRKVYRDGGDEPEIAQGSECRLRGGNTYANRRFESIFAYLPPTEPVKYEVRRGDLLDRIATEYGVSPSRLMEDNGLDSPELTGVDDLLVPNQEDPVPIQEGELLSRIASDYALSADALAEANDLETRYLQPGQVLTIPNADDTVMVQVPIDSVSVVPGAPHGAKVATNLAVALTAMEHLATSESVIRRKGVVFAFLDAENVGGLSSRTFGEYVLLNKEDGLGSPFVADPQEKIAKYRAVADWLDDAEQAPLDDEVALWFGMDWLPRQLEKARVTIAETRVEIIKRQQALDSQLRDELSDLRERDEDLYEQKFKEIHDERYASMQKVIDRYQQWMDFLSDIRRETLRNQSWSWAERIKAFWQRLGEEEHREYFQYYDVTQKDLADRLRRELAEEVETHSFHENNIEVVGKCMDLLHPEGQEPVLAWLYDLSQGSSSVGMNTAKEFRDVGPAGAGNAERLAERFSKVVGFAGIRAGWDEQWSWLRDEDQSEFPMVVPEGATHYSEFWTAGNVALLPASTYNDRRELLDTPHDTPEHTDFENLSVQARTMLLLTKLGVENPTDSLAPDKVDAPAFGRLLGAAVEYNIRSGINATAPVARSWVYYPALKNVDWASATKNSATYMGSRRGILRITLQNGSYSMPLETVDYSVSKGEPLIYAYRLNRDRALFDKAMDRGQLGTQQQSMTFKLRDGEDEEKNLILADVYPWVFAPGPDPMDYQPIGGTAGDRQDLRVVDAVRNGSPRHYALDNPQLQYSEQDVDSTVLYMSYEQRQLGEGLPGLEDIPGFDPEQYKPERRRARVLAQKSMQYKMLLVGDLPEKAKDQETKEVMDLKGEGYAVGPDGNDRNLVLPLTPLRVAEDMYRIARYRYDLYEQFGIHDSSVYDALERSRAKIDRSRQAAEEHDWQSSVGLAREGWGILVKNLPRILKLGREAVFSAVILMGLLVPASAFLERLVIGGSSIVARLVGTAIIFVLGVVFMKFFHPAFDIAVSPFVVMIAFTMILMALIVLVLSYQRFEVLVRRARAAAGEVEGDEISLMGSLGTALSLGVSNLKKRPARTFLTVFTVTVLTFSIITFVSVRGEDEMHIRPVPLEQDVAGRRVDPLAPKYEGIMFRNFSWTELKDTFVSAVYSEFGPEHEMTTRGYYLEVEGGNNMDREGVNQIKVRHGDRMDIITGVMTFMPNEPDFSGLNEAVSNNEWFRAEDRSRGIPAERFAVILPDNCAEAVGITPDMIYDEDGNRLDEDELPKVLMRNREWRVVGILDTDHADRIRDVNGKSLAMVDYRRSAITASAGSGDIINEKPLYHMSWKDLAIVPHAASDEVQAKNRSVAVRFGGNQDQAQFYKDFALRTNRTVFGTRDGEPALVTAKNVSSIGGLAKIVVPVLLCILIVLNTMLANVEERKGEVGMLGAIGLSPGQISFLLLSESSVFSVLGIVFGTFSGLLFANIVGWVQNVNPEFLAGLSLNFTSLSALGLAMLTGVVVLLATLVPANKAARLAAPSGMGKWELPEPSDHSIHFDLPFTLTRGNAVGMMAFFRRFLLNHTEAASPGFNCRNIELDMLSGEEEALRIRADMWLSPYDLDVAQKMEMKIVPTENEGVFGVQLNLHRFSGTEDAWLRTNYGFMDLVRHQFLLWRNLDNDARMNYITEGAELFRDQHSEIQESG